jgi:hypothetical protein
MLAAIEMSGWVELCLAIGAVLILAISIFGIDAVIFRKKRPAGPVIEFPKRRVHYVVEEVDDDSELDVPNRWRR